jgi:UDP-3-O-[3-hydroxymyristoyl] N-acetylglucosamine deacetylase
LPASDEYGIEFVRRDLDGEPIPAAHAFLKGSSLATTLARGPENRVSTVEHLLSALHGLGIDNARIEVYGPEVPIMDGSALPFVERILQAGVARLAAPRRFLTLRRPVSVRQGDKEIMALPANDFRATYAIDFPHSAIGYQAVSLSVSEAVFVSSIAPARTFCLYQEIQAMRGAGFARGGSLENAVVVGERGVLNDSLRFPDEFVRHKVLDLIGDLAMLGVPLRAHVIAHKGGHRLHAALVGAILAENDAWSLGTSEERLPAAELARFEHLTEQIVPRPALSA